MLAVVEVPKRFTTIQAAARSHGVSIGTLRRWVRDGRLTSYKPSQRVLLDVAELEAIIRMAKV
jgi:excisionase family DNA binding protein